MRNREIDEIAEESGAILIRKVIHAVFAEELIEEPAAKVIRQPPFQRSAKKIDRLPPAAHVLLELIKQTHAGPVRIL